MNQTRGLRTIGGLPARRRWPLSLLVPVLLLSVLGSWVWTDTSSAVAERPFSRETTLRRQVSVEPDDLDFIRDGIYDRLDVLFRSEILPQRNGTVFGEISQIVRTRLSSRFRRSEMQISAAWRVDDLIAQSPPPACSCAVELTGRATFRMVGGDLHVEAGLEPISRDDLDCGVCRITGVIDVPIGETQYLIPEQDILRELPRAVRVSHRRPVFTLPPGIRATDVEVRTDFVPVSVRYDDDRGLVLTADVRLNLSGVLQYPDAESDAVLADAETSLDGTLASLGRRLELRTR